jgi:uncharacterized protein YyaL (SSP411 family)
MENINETRNNNKDSDFVLNHLGDEKSPYLILHKDNPVDWYPWSDEAFRKAKEEDKPIFLSIGYSTCHWCHVMARESFMDKEVAQELNHNYVAIKVDREERPDIDHVYMTVCQMLTGSGGWPLTVIMTPEKIPFFAGTYFPKNSRFGLPGLLNILEVVSTAWKTDRQPLLDQAGNVYKALVAREEEASSVSTVKGDTSYLDLVKKAYRDYLEMFDDSNGGFGTAPKFPSVHSLLFLLRYWKNSGAKKALQMAEKSLCHIYAGGIYDHIGYGFFRYSTDAKWMIPHFEKMLYDNAMLLMGYTELYQATQKDVYAMIADEIVTFLKNEMLGIDGGFFSAIDAESEGEEGKYYLFTPEDLEIALGLEDTKQGEKLFGIGSRAGKFQGKWVPNLWSYLIRLDEWTIPDLEELDPNTERLRKRLLDYRSRRVRPNIDDKILTSWNALTAAALAKAAKVMGREDYLELADNCLSLITKRLTKDGILYARLRDDEIAYLGYLDDYAFLVWALIEMHQSTLKKEYLGLALRYCEDMLSLFWEDEESTFYLSRKDNKDLIVRPRDTFDGAIPSGNSVAIMDLLRLSHLTGRQELEDIAWRAIETLIEEVRRNPTAYGHLLSAILYGAKTALDITVVGSHYDSGLSYMLEYLNRLYLPDLSINRESENMSQDERPYMILCEEKTCSEPIRTIGQLQMAILERSQKVKGGL